MRSETKVCALNLISSVRQHSLDSFLVAFRHHHVDIQMTLSLIGLLGQDVTRMRMAALNFAGRGRAKTLRRSPMCFQFWHIAPWYKSKIVNPGQGLLVCDVKAGRALASAAVIARRR